MVDEKDFVFLDARYRKIEDCDRISDAVKDDVSAIRTDHAATKAIVKGILAVAIIMATFIIPACLKIIMGGAL